MAYIGRLIYFLIILSVSSFSASANEEVPITTDSRVKIFVYNEYDVYSLLTHYGYQSNIEFSRKEKIVTISIGDRIGWQVVPSGNRLFIRALEEGAHTNMTVITNKRAYQFDLKSSRGGALKPSEELLYVMRFYYPDEIKKASPVAPIARAGVSVAPGPVSMTAPAPVLAVKQAELAPPPTQPAVPRVATARRAMNYNYSFTGPNALAPLKVFDNGRATFFKLSQNPSVVKTKPRFFVISDTGQEIPVSTVSVDRGFLMVGTVARRYVVRYGNAYINIYKEG